MNLNVRFFSLQQTTDGLVLVGTHHCVLEWSALNLREKICKNLKKTYSFTEMACTSHTRFFAISKLIELESWFWSWIVGNLILFHVFFLIWIWCENIFAPFFNYLNILKWILKKKYFVRLFLGKDNEQPCWLWQFSRFLDASSHLYMRVCLSAHPSVCPSVGPSVRSSFGPSIRPSVHWSVGPSVTRFFF